MAQHLKQLNLIRLAASIQKRAINRPKKSFSGLIPPWMIEKIEREKKPLKDDRPALEIEPPPSELYEIGPPQDQESDKKKDEDKQGAEVVDYKVKKR